MRHNWEFRARDVASVTTARREFAARLRDTMTSDANLDASALIFGELIANAIKYGQNPITATLERGERGGCRTRLIVEDGGHGFARDEVREPDPSATGGRGFAIATKLARSIQLERLPGRFRITVELPV